MGVPLAFALALASFAVLVPRQVAADAAPARPNVLLIVTDDHAWSVFNRKLMPATFGRIAGQGVLFRRAYVNTPLCCPSRAQILTGLYEHHTGVDQNPVPLERPTLPMALKSAGYRTMLAGKYLNSWETCDPRPEFDSWACTGAAEDHTTYSLRGPDINVDGVWQHHPGWQTDVLADMVLGFVDDTPQDRPFFAIYAPTSPHLPADDIRYDSMPVTPPRPPSFNANTMTEGSPRYARRPGFTEEEIAGTDDRYTRMAHSVRALDDAVASLLDGLGDRARDTLVAFVSDNGFMYGEHRRFGKNDAWEESVRVPMVISYPTVRRAPSVSDAIVQTVDVTATIADAAGIRWGADGTSLLPILAGRRSSVRSAALIQHCRAESRGTVECSGLSFDGDQTRVPGYQGVVTGRFKYVEYDDGSRQLIDLKRDPHELVNLADRSSYRKVRSALAARLDAMLRDTSLQTTIVTGPRGASTTRAPMFTFFSPSRLSTYRCRLTHGRAEGAWYPCGPGPELLGPLEDGRYLFEVAGTDERGRTDPSPASRKFSISSTGPVVEIVTHPRAKQSETSAAFVFTKRGSSEAVCSLTPPEAAPSWTSCDEGIASYEELGEGPWVFQVRAKDQADVWTAPPAAWPFVVDATGPSFRFAAHPALATRDRRARFSFAPNESTVRPWTCSLDGRGAVDCSRGRFEASVDAGQHTLTVSASDGAGNVGETEYTWAVDGSRPGASLGNKPPPVSSEHQWRFDPTSRSDDEAFFLCSLDDGPTMPCAPTAPLLLLTDGNHTFTVWAVDLAGNRSLPDSYTWKVVPAPPEA